MFALVFALLLLLLPSGGAAPCDRRAALGSEVIGASREAGREEALRGLAARMRAERSRAPEDACAPDLLRTEALSYLFLGEHLEALALLDRLLADYPALDPDIEGRTHTNRGYILARLGRTADAALAYAAAADLADDVEPSMGARFLMEASKTYRLLRHPDAATTYLEAAAGIAEAIGDGSLKAQVMTERALIARPDLFQRSAQTDSLARASLAYAYEAHVLYDDQPDTEYQAFRTLLLIAELQRYLKQDGAAAAALDEAERLLPSVARSHPESRSRLSITAGQFDFAQGHHASAETRFYESLRLARQVGDTQVEMDALRDLGDLAAFDKEANDPADYERATRFYQQAITIAEERRTAMGLQDWSVSAFEEYQTPYRRLVRSLLHQGKATEAFIQLDAVRARYLRDLRTSAALRRTLGPEQQQAIAELNERLREERAVLSDPSIPTADRARHEHAATKLQAEIEALTGARPAPPRPLDIPSLQAALARREQHLVTYFLLGEEVTAFVVRADTFAVRTLATSPSEIAAEAEALDAFWKQPDGTHRAPPLDALHRLYTLIFAPVADLLPPGEPVVIVPEGALSALPFAVFVEEATGRFGYDDAPFLLRRHPISTELAASLVVESGGPARREPSEQPFVAFGRSRFEGAPRSRRADGALGPLPYVPEELDRVVDGLSGGVSYLNDAATEHAFDASLGAPRLLHLATHVLPDAELPLYSHAVLWDDPEAPDDGILHAYEIEDRLLDLDLVVLSGCETGRGVGRRGEGMQSLQYAFRAAGARSVVATLWQVDDRATAYVMDRFYHHLGQGTRKDVALQRAQLDYLDAHDGALASPALWAAAVLYGDPSPLDWTDDRGGALGWVLLGLGALALAALPIAYRRRRARLHRA